MLASVNSVQASSTSRLFWWKDAAVADTARHAAVRKCDDGKKSKGEKKKEKTPEKQGEKTLEFPYFQGKPKPTVSSLIICENHVNRGFSRGCCITGRMQSTPRSASALGFGVIAPATAVLGASAISSHILGFAAG